MWVRIEATDPDGEYIGGTLLHSDLLIRKIKSNYQLPAQCMDVELDAPPGYRFDGSPKAPGQESTTIEICPPDEPPLSLVIPLTVIPIAD
jgi:hypothetical protein